MKKILLFSIIGLVIGLLVLSSLAGIPVGTRSSTSPRQRELRNKQMQERRLRRQPPGSILDARILRHIPAAQSPPGFRWLLVQSNKKALVRAVTGSGISSSLKTVNIQKKEPWYVYDVALILELPADHKLLNKPDKESFVLEGVIRSGVGEYYDLKPLAKGKQTYPKYSLKAALDAQKKTKKAEKSKTLTAEEVTALRQEVRQLQKDLQRINARLKEIDSRLAAVSSSQ